MAAPTTTTFAFLFTDIEGSTRLWEAHPTAMRAALARHDALLRAAIAAEGGRVFKTIGDAFCATFKAPAPALAAALEAQRAMATEPWPAETPIRVRMALHAGAAEERDGDWFGPTVNGVARLLAVGHGGQTLLSQAAADLAPELLPRGASLLDLGSHRLRDLALPVRVYQLVHPDLDAKFPSLKSLEGRPHNLPIQLTSFVGRERELAEVLAQLAEARLLTLTGPGGSGKTRLALQAASERVPELPDGAWLVDLAPVADGNLVAAATADALGLREEPGRPLDETLRNWLAPRELLLVLDNCEHVVEAAARLAGGLLGACPKLRILATSREPLRVVGEVVRTASTMTLPDAPALERGGAEALSAVLASEAGQLFAERAAAAHAGFALTTENAAAVGAICRRLDGIPLALELAAARVRALAPAAMLERLDERFRLLAGGSRTALPRQQTLRATIDWSYDLLDPPEPVAFARLAAFRGGWSLEAAEQVAAGEGLADWEVLDALIRLVEKSLVVTGEEERRYRYLETVRAYAAERLAESGEGDTVAAQHRAHYLARTEALQARFEAGDQAPALAEMAVELDNVRASIENAVATGDGPTAVRFMAALWQFWQIRGHVTESWARWRAVEPFLDAPGVDPRRAARVVTRAGDAAVLLGDGPAARRLFAEALRRHQANDDHDWAAVTQNSQGILEMREGHHAAAKAAFTANLAAIDAQGLDPRRRVAPLCNLGLLALEEHDYPAARGYLTQAQQLTMAFDDQARNAVLIWNLGVVAMLEGDRSAAWQACRASLAIRRQLDNRWGLVVCLELAGWLAATEDPPRALRLLGAAEAVRAPLSSALEPFQQQLHDQAVVTCRVALTPDDYAAAWTEGTTLPLDMALAMVEGDGG